MLEQNQTARRQLELRAIRQEPPEELYYLGEISSSFFLARKLISLCATLEAKPWEITSHLWFLPRAESAGIAVRLGECTQAKCAL